MLRKIRSVYTLNKIFGILLKRKKLDLIRYNKKLQSRTSTEKKDYEDYISLKDFRRELDTNIYDVDIPILDLRKKISKNESLEWLIKINFKDLEELNLSENKISDLSILEKSNFRYLKYLNLNYDDIADINIFKKINFNLLNKLTLYHNQIIDISPLNEVNFKELKELDLFQNKIIDINALDKVDFPKLEIIKFRT